jgi:PPIC-type PPIASE domain
MRPRTPRRTRLSLAALLIALLAVSACGSAGVAPAASIDETEITQESLETELDAIGDNADYQASLEQALGVPLAGRGTGTWDSSFVAQMLTTRIYYTLLERGLVDLDGTISEDDRQAARAQLAEQFGDSGVLDELPDDYRKLLEHQNALFVAVQRLIDDRVPTGRAFYNENPERFDVRCVSHILIEGDDPDAAKDTADALARRIQSGETFAAVAAAESDDTANAAQGGDLGCHPRGTYAESFDEAAWDAQIGVVTGPTQTEFGTHLLVVRSASRQTFDEAGASIDTLREAELTDRFNDLLFRAACDPDLIEVNSRYGSWDQRLCDSRSGLPSVLPPQGSSTTAING